MLQVQFWAPASSGAGVSLIIAYLNGCAVPRLLNYRNLITKWVGTILGVSSNLALGPEAPMVHLGASVAHCYTHAACGGQFSCLHGSHVLVCSLHGTRIGRN